MFAQQQWPSKWAFCVILCYSVLRCVTLIATWLQSETAGDTPRDHRLGFTTPWESVYWSFSNHKNYCSGAKFHITLDVIQEIYLNLCIPSVFDRNDIWWKKLATICSQVEISFKITTALGFRAQWIMNICNFPKITLGPQKMNGNE